MVKKYYIPIYGEIKELNHDRYKGHGRPRDSDYDWRTTNENEAFMVIKGL